MIILDTNVLSAFMRREPEAVVVEWLDRQARASIWTTSVTVLEIRFGLQTMAAGRRRTVLFETFGSMLEAIGNRVAPFDEQAAACSATVMAERKQRGRLGELRDAMIAGIALSRNAALATRNTNHFMELGARLINPWNA